MSPKRAISLVCMIVCAVLAVVLAGPFWLAAIIALIVAVGDDETSVDPTPYRML